MTSQTVRVELGGVPSCFATISWTLQRPSTNSANLNVLRLETLSGNIIYISVISQGQHSSNRGDNLPVIKLHTKFATALSLGDGELVTASQENGAITTVPKAEVVCVSKNDWEILESNAESVCAGLLNQIRIVYPGLKFPFWISKSLSINLMIEKISPEGLKYGILNDNSEVIVPSAAPTRDIIPQIKGKFRIHPIPVPDSVLSKEASLSLVLRNTRNIFLFYEDAQDENIQGAGDEGFPAIIQPLDHEKDVSIYVKAFFIEKSQFPEHILYYFSVTNPPSIFVHPELIKEFGMEEKTFVYLTTQDIQLKDDISHFKILPLLGENQKRNIDKSTAFSDSVSKCREFIEAALSLGIVQHGISGSSNGPLLIEGREGSGKSWMCQNLSKSLEGSPYHVNWEIVPCAKFRGKKPETMEKELQPVLQRSLRFQPSIIIFDDLDIITPTGQALQENLQEQFLHFKICETIMEAISTVRGQKVVIVATAKSKESLNAYWKSKQGFHFFHQVVSIPLPNFKERQQIFTESLKQLNSDIEIKLDADIRKILKGIHDQHATPRLIRNIARKFASLGDPFENSEIYTDLAKFVHQEISFSEGMTKGADKSVEKNLNFWEDIGGLQNIKEELTKILNWPIKYQKLFKNAPIKLPSGILLYGYPGTGKTLLGLSIPSLVNAKFIHIKGPELLSKYIGASEQAVQDVFKRARSWSPCVIFFDEFDSLVPRRGHDSTGVTDRVVNQFLAEMDGIEGGLGEGVYLVGATSRPDLIDPAVLRPGRLDKHLFFDFPSNEDREDILRKLGQKVNLQMNSDDSVLNALQGLTGADIHSLICSAQLIAVQRFLRQIEISGTSTVKKDEVTTSDIPVTVEDLKEALSSFRPSVQGDELTKFKQIYQAFSNGKLSDSAMKPRATLA